MDACLTEHVDSPDRAAYLPQLRAAGITILRERGPNPALAGLKAAGFRVVSCLGLGSLPIEQPGDVLPEDLLAVFDAAKAMQRLHGRYVDIWEMVNEPDVGYCPDLPDRVAAFQKAVYLGIKSESEGESESESEWKVERGDADVAGLKNEKAENERRKAESGRAEIGKAGNGITRSKDLSPERVGAGHTPLVLMGALALPPGPWLERAARNGLLDYTDAYNFHFYGFEGDMAGVIRAHEAFAAKWVDLRARAIVGSDLASGPPSQFPIWITECGINAVIPGDFLNSERRRMQADFTLATAQQARAAECVAVFMPFILVGKGVPQALTLSPDQPLPAWNAYAGYSRRHSFPSRMLAMPPHDPNPVVVQWLPDNRTTVPHKVSGTYRFLEGQPIRGLLLIYNLGGESVHGILEGGSLRCVRLESRDLHPIALTTGGYAGQPAFQSSALTIPALGRLDVPVAFFATTPGYFREYWKASFLGDRRGPSPVCFGLETMPGEDDFIELPVRFDPANQGRTEHPELDGTKVTSKSGAWTGINGLVVRTEMSGKELDTQDPESKTRAAGRSLILRVSATKMANDPLWPTMAIARVRGLPPRGLFHLQMDRTMNSDFGVRVDLVDRKGQRFTIWENYGASYFEPREDVWLNLNDFHVYFWGRCSEHPILRPQDVDEIRLRLYFAQANDPRLIRLSLWQARSDPGSDP